MSPGSFAARYATRVPRYTSYPTAIEFSPLENDEHIKRLLRSVKDVPVSVYIHIPFCRSLCYFCACHKEIVRDDAPVQEYLELLKREVELVQALSSQQLIMAELHFGGGSPSIVAPEAMRSLLNFLRAHWRGYESAGKSIELDPRTTTEALVHCLAEQGLKRLSFGVQDFDEHVMQLVHREQPYSVVAQAMTWARQAGIEQINFDLISGLPGQTLDSLRESIQKTIELSPGRIALYSYAHVQWRARAQRTLEKSNLPSPEMRYEFYCEAEKLLRDAGYQRIGLDHFALPDDELAIALREGRLRRNFMGYTTSRSRDVLGLGTSSISDISGTLYQNHSDRERYRTCLEQGMLPAAKVLVRDAEDLIRAYIIEQIMCEGHVSLDCVKQNFPAFPASDAIFADALRTLQPMIDDDLVCATVADVRVTPQGRYFVRHVASAFDPYLLSKGEQVFSSGS